MAVVANFTPTGTLAQYDAAIDKLKEKNAFPSPGLISHACYGDDNSWRVTDVWESQEAFEAFGQILGPILAEAGVEAGQPDVKPVHNYLVVKS